MSELNDYSGPYKPDLQFSDFSKEFLLKLMDVWQLAWKIKDDAWLGAVIKRVGLEEAMECAKEMWMQVAETVNPKYAEIGNIQLNTMLDCLKCQQLPLDNTIGELYQNEVEILDENRVIMTTKHCVVLADVENTLPQMIGPMCEMCGKIAEKYLVSPRARLSPIKLPPREGPDDIACKWEYTLQE